MHQIVRQSMMQEYAMALDELDHLPERTTAPAVKARHDPLPRPGRPLRCAGTRGAPFLVAAGASTGR